MLEEYVRKSFGVRAVRVTEENITEVAEMVGDEVRVNTYLYDDRIYFKTPGGFGQAVFVGDWLVSSEGPCYTRYTNEEFEAVFEKPDNAKSTE